jgi:hypothetical protein
MGLSSLEVVSCSSSPFARNASSFCSHVEVKCCAAKLALIVQVHANLVQVGDFLLDLFHHHVGTHRRCVLMSSGCDRKSNFEIYGWSY